MKKIISLLSLIAVLSVMACSDKPAQKEVIVVPATPPAVIIVRDPPEKAGTTITLDKNGVRVEAKNGGVIIKNK